MTTHAASIFLLASGERLVAKVRKLEGNRNKSPAEEASTIGFGFDGKKKRGS